MFKFALSYVLLGSLASVLQAESLEKTFTVAVSNAATHHIEMAQSTFRYGATNGLVERLEGNRFVPVSFISPENLYLSKDRLDLIRRLQTIQLPPIMIESMPLSNAVKRIKELIRNADTTTHTPVRLSYRDSKKSAGNVHLIPLNLPATNALSFLRFLNGNSSVTKCSPNCRRSLPFNAMDNSPAPDVFAPKRRDPDCCTSNQSFGGSTIVMIRNGELIIKIWGVEDWGCGLTRCYRVPPVFFKHYPSEDLFVNAIEAKMGLNNRLTVAFSQVPNFLRVEYCGRIDFGFDELDQLSYFEEQMLTPYFRAFLGWPKTCLSVSDGNERMLFAYASDEGSFGGIWRYCAVRGEDGVLRDRFIPCPIPRGIEDIEALKFIAHGEGVDTSGQIKKKWFAYTTNRGTVFRFDGEQFIQIESEWQAAQEPMIVSGRVNKDSPLFMSIILPEFQVPKGLSISNAIFCIEQLMNDYITTTNHHVHVVLNKNRVQKQEPASPEKYAPFVLPVKNKYVLPKLFGQPMTLHEAIKQLAYSSGIYPVFDDTHAKIELTDDYADYFRKASREKEYRIPARVGEKMPRVEDWERLFYEDYLIPREDLRIVSCSPLGTGVLKIRFVPGPWSEFIDSIVPSVGTRYPGRFQLERHVRDGGIRLVLVDHDTGTNQTYRTQIDPTGKRTERFELPEPLIP